MTPLLHFLESLPPGPLYGLITALAAVENVFPPVPADSAVALGAFLAGRGMLSAWTVFLLTWGATSAAPRGCTRWRAATGEASSPGGWGRSCCRRRRSTTSPASMRGTGRTESS